MTECESGKFASDVEGVGFAIAAVRQFILRLNLAGPDEATALRTAAGWPDGNCMKLAEKTQEHASGNTRFNTPERSGNAAARHVSNLGRWLAEATPEMLSTLAFFLKSRPIEPSARLGGNLLPRAADPGAVAAAIAVVTEWALAAHDTRDFPTGDFPNRKPTPEDCRALLESAPSERIEKIRATYAPGIDATTFRKILNEQYGVKRAAGARKK